MKLIYITNNRIPTERAYGYQICKMCEEFGSLIGEVELWTAKRKNEIGKSVFEYYGIKKNFLIKEIKSFDFLKLDKYIGRISFLLHSISFLIFLFFQKVDRNSIIYSRNVEIAFLFSLKKYKVIYEAHSWPESKTWLYNYLLKRLYKIIVISWGLEKLCLDQGLGKEKILVAPDGVDLKEFDIQISKEEARKKLDLPLDKKLILYSGHLYEWKGARTLADAANLLDKNKLIVFVGGRDEDINKFKTENKKIKNIIILGRVEHKFIPIYLKAADVLVLPNSKKEKISRHYTSPLKMFEYMASKRPIIASDLPSLREILKKDNCIFFEPDNSEDLANKIDLLFNNIELQKKIADKAYTDVNNYSWQKRVNNIMNFIKI